MASPRIGVVGATGAVGSVTLELLRARGYGDVRLFASARSAGKVLDGVTVEEATPDVLAAGDLELCLFSVGTSASRELVPHAVRGGAVCVDKSAAYRLEPGVPLVVPEVNGERVAEHQGIVANPNCCAIPLTCALKPLHDAAGLARVRVATYQSVSGAGAAGDGAAAVAVAGGARPPHGLGFRRRRVRRGGEAARGDAQDPRAAVAGGQRDLRPRARAGRPRRGGLGRDRGTALAEQARAILAAAPGIRLEHFPTPGRPPGADEVLVGRIRRDPTLENGLALFVVSDNLRKGAALNAIQIAELLLDQQRVAA